MKSSSPEFDVDLMTAAPDGIGVPTSTISTGSAGWLAFPEVARLFKLQGEVVDLSKGNPVAQAKSEAAAALSVSTPARRSASVAQVAKRSAAGPEPLYGSEEQVALAVLGPGHLKEWRERAAILERDGLPVVDPLMGGRYLPAVRRFFDRRNGVTDGHAVPQKADGRENFKCPPSRKTRPVSTSETVKAANVSRIGLPPVKP